MRRLARLIPPLAIAVIASGALLDVSNAQASIVVLPGISHAPPDVKGKRGKHGVELTAAQRKALSERQKLSPLRSTGKPHVSTPAKANSKWNEQQSERDPRRPFRLNIGMCGRAQADGTVPGPNWCQPVEPERPAEERTPTDRVVQPRPEDVTWEQVWTETKDVVFPALTVHVQPSTRTLVNLETVVWTDKNQVLTTTVTLLGFPVVVQAVPLKYQWHFGDGTSVETSTPGAPYPSKEITHKYLKRGDVRLTVTTFYGASYTVAGLTRYVGDIPITGPATPLQVREAVPVLVDPQR